MSFRSIRSLLFVSGAWALSAALVGCVFDGASLEQRRCGQEGACPEGQRCVAGFCAAVEGGADLDDDDAEVLARDVIEDAPVDEVDVREDVGLVEDAPALDEPQTPPDGCEPSLEVCDGLDNDCDGQIDEGLPVGDLCAVGEGACRAEGVRVCREGQVVCDAEPGAPTPEACDGLDNDCDGLVDNSPDDLPLVNACYDIDSSVVGIGECVAGVRRCESGGVITECEGAVYPVPELCDGLDNDCDGDVDEAACPEEVGCADGSREAFGDLIRFPDLAGCSGRWFGLPSLRTAKLASEACGQAMEAECVSPADLCAPGWDVCARGGEPGALREALSGSDACASAGQGRWVAAMSHCERIDWLGGCVYASPGGCSTGGTCAEPICCGGGCVEGGCVDGLYDGATRIPATSSFGCGALPSSAVDGVMCCRTR